MRIRGSMAERPGPRGPASTVRAGPGYAMVAEEEIRLKFAQEGYLQSAAGNTPQQGTQHRLLQIGRGRKSNVPQIGCRLEQDHTKHMAFRAAPHSSHRLFAADSGSLNLDALASVQLQVHHNRSASAADVYCPSFLPQVFDMFCNAGDTNVQGQKDTIALPPIFLHC